MTKIETPILAFRIGSNRKVELYIKTIETDVSEEIKFRDADTGDILKMLDAVSGDNVALQKRLLETASEIDEDANEIADTVVDLKEYIETHIVHEEVRQKVLSSISAILSLTTEINVSNETIKRLRGNAEMIGEAVKELKLDAASIQQTAGV